VVRLPGGAVVGALAVVNAVGDVVARDGAVLAGGGAWASLLEHGLRQPPAPGANTTLGVLVTDAALDKPACRKLAEVGQDALALAIRPAHTMFDGDTVFALSTGRAEADMTTLGVAAVEAMWRAVERAVTHG
jgi:L-aminopeptidase/D-esterase-like protein